MSVPHRHGSGPPVVVETTPEDPDCPVCGRPGILSALLPHTMTDGRGDVTPGRAVAVLCETCDIDHPEAGPLIAYFAVHGAIDQETLEQGTRLVSDWLTTAEAKPSPGGAPAAENDARPGGDLFD